MQISFSKIISEIETFCNKSDLNHRFVGSASYGGLLNKKTTYKINIEEKTVKLSNHNKLSLLRTDKTIRDVDIILFCKDAKQIKEFKQFIQKLKSPDPSFPLISVEAAIYPSLGKRNKLLQFVYALEVNENNQLFLTFDTLKQNISWESIEPWTVILENGVSFTTRNPVADYFAYQFRSPSGIRPKDEKKVLLLGKLANSVIKEGEKKHIDYLSDNYYGKWQKFIDKLQKTNAPLIILKKRLSKYYWQTIGTYLAHGKGAGKFFLSLQNQFTGMKQ